MPGNKPKVKSSSDKAASESAKEEFKSSSYLIAEMCQHLPTSDVMKLRQVSRFWKQAIEQVAWPTVLHPRVFSQSIIDQARAMTGNILGEAKSEQDVQATDRLVFYICTILKRHPHLNFENVCDELLSLSNYKTLVEQAITRYRTYRDAFVQYTQRQSTLPTDPEFTLLYLNHGNIDVAGAQAIADALRNPNCKLTSLSLSYNYIGGTEAQAIAQAVIVMKHAPTGHTIRIKINDAFDRYLAQAEADFVREQRSYNSCSIMLGANTKK